MPRLALSFLILLSFAGCSREPARPAAGPAVLADSTAQPPRNPDLSPDVSDVASAWNDEELLRVVIVTGGTEHISSQAYLQWLVPVHDNEADSSHRVVSTIQVQELGSFVSLGPPRIERAGAGSRVFLEGTHNKTMEEVRFTLYTDRAGEYRVVSRKLATGQTRL